MIVCEKTIKLKRDKEGKPTTEIEYFVSLHPNHYNIPVTIYAYDSVEVGKSYELSFTPETF